MTNFRTALAAAVMAASLTVALAASPAIAGDAPMLAAGKPAGVEQAQRGSSHLLLIAGAVTLAVIAIVVATTTTDNAQCGTACTVTPPTTT